VNLSDFFLNLATSYERTAGLHSPAQDLIAQSPVLLADHAPAGMFILGGGGKGMATYTPWVGFFNPDETDSPQRGLYVVYILSEDMELLTLTLNQGMELLRKAFGDREARRKLSNDALAIRNHLEAARPAMPADKIDLRSRGARQAAYEAGDIACRTYAVGALPPEAELRSDLASMLALYDDAITARRELALSAPGSIASPSSVKVTTTVDPLANFRPKDDGDYRVSLEGRALVKTRRHERLIRDYAMDRAAKGFTASTQHPRDLVLRDSITGDEYLVEAKVLYKGNATDAVRAAIGQLLTYAFFLYDEAKPRLVALFTEPIGTAYVDFLERHDIASVWWDASSWMGSPLAIAWKLA
jgi:hypothetical protein